MIFLVVPAATHVEGSPPEFMITKITIPGTHALGWSLASSGDRFIAGDLSGNAYVFERLSDFSWTQPIKLMPTYGASTFGQSVDISGDIAAVGAPSEGSSYLFKRNQNGSWTEQAQFTKSDPSGWSLFGNTVEVSGNTVMISDLRPTESGSNGTTYIYEADQTGWHERATLSNGVGHNVYPIALQETTAVITSYDYSTYQEAHYVYQRGQDGSWTQQATLDIPGDYQGTMGCGISGDTVIFGSLLSFTNSSGAAHVFRGNEDGSSWAYEAMLTPADSYNSQYFGRGAVAVLGDMALVGGYPVGGYGYAYLFQRDQQDLWAEQWKVVASDTSSWDYFGRSVAISGNAFIIGASGDDDAGTDAGAIYIYTIVPEPSSLILFGAGATSLLGYAWRRRKRTA